MNVELNKNGVSGNYTENKINNNIENNNELAILDPKSGGKMDRMKSSSPINITKPFGGGSTRTNGPDVVITVQPPNQNESVEKPRPRQRRTSDVIDSIGMDGPRSPADRRASADVFFASTSPSDRGYSSGLSSPRTPLKPPENSHRRVGDATDAALMNQVAQQQPPVNTEPIGLPTVEALMPVAKDSEEYNMNHPRRGRAVIINNDEFESMSKREGSDIDVKNLQALYTALGFEITIHQNLYYQEIKKIIDDLAREDHSDADCIVLTVLTHGMGSGFILAKDHPYRVETLWNAFTADQCPSLAGKPKIFFVQACRGESLDPGVTLRRSITETDSGTENYKIPVHADFLLAFSSVEGYFSFRNPDSGTWFIQCLCEELIENGQKHDLLKLLTRTARRVALDHESYNDIIPWHHQQKQVPTITSMLIREVYFRPKK